MQALDFLLHQPPFDLPSKKRAGFDLLLDTTPPGSVIDYQLAYPKWQFLSYLCNSRDLILHGSQSTEINVVEPRRAVDVKAFSKQDAVYATTDGIWAIYFAIVNRRGFQPLTLFNSCLNIRISPEQILGPLYFFSITGSALIQNPWCDGMVYILPRTSFKQEPPQQMFGTEIIFPHWASLKPAKPVAKLSVQPKDFPFLSNIHGHNDEKLVQLMAADPNGFPWPDALEM